MARSLTSVVGALIGGFAVAEFSIQVALAVDLATFCLAAILYRRFAKRAGPESRPRAEPGSRVSRRDLLRAILLNRVVFGLAASFTLVTLAIGIMNSDVSRAFDEQLGNSHAYGYILAVISAGYVCSEILTGYMRSQSVARRSVGLAFMASGAAAFVLSYATTLPIAYLALFMFGAADGITEVVRDSLIQLNTQRSVRSGVFAVVNSVQTGGMIIGLAVAPLVAHRFSSGTSLRIVALGCVASGLVAGVCLVGRGGDSGETLQMAAAGVPAGGELGAAVTGFGLRDRDGAKVALGELTADGRPCWCWPGARRRRGRAAMLRELAEGLPAVRVWRWCRAGRGWASRPRPCASPTGCATRWRVLRRLGLPAAPRRCRRVRDRRGRRAAAGLPHEQHGGVDPGRVRAFAGAPLAAGRA
jgi:hypothetical protein